MKSGSRAFELPVTKDSTHPADDARLRTMIIGLKLVGFASEANMIEAEWEKFLRNSLQLRDAKYKLIYPTKLLEHCVVLCLQGVKNIGGKLYSNTGNNGITKLLNSAWEKFLSCTHSEYFDWEKINYSLQLFDKGELKSTP